MNEKINYIEFQTRDMAATGSFFAEAFGWSIQSYGPDYTAFSDAGVEGGFYPAEQASQVTTGGALIVLYTEDLEECRDRVAACGALIVREIFSFPGGRRFHFEEPGGNELAVWSEK